MGLFDTVVKTTNAPGAQTTSGHRTPFNLKPTQAQLLAGRLSGVYGQSQNNSPAPFTNPAALYSKNLRSH